MAAINDRQGFRGALEAVIDRQRRRNEAHPDKSGRYQPVRHSHLVGAEMPDYARQNPRHDELGECRNDKDRRFHAVGLYLFFGFADCGPPGFGKGHVINRAE